MGKNQHYVPQFLLRNFAVPGCRGKAVAVADLEARVLRTRASVSGQCAGAYTYGRDGRLESALCDLEGMAAAVVRRLVAGEPPPERGSPDWLTLLTFVAIQQGRTPAAAAEVEAAAAQTLQAAQRTAEVAPELAAALCVTGQQAVVESLRGSAEMAASLGDLADLVVTNESDVGFVLPDVGVVFHNDWARRVRGMGVTGFACSGLQVVLPLSPRHLLVKYDPAVYRVAGDNQLVRSLYRGTAARVNRLLLAHSERHAYFDGRESTSKYLAKFEKHPRAPRAARMRTDRLLEEGGSRVILHGYQEHPDTELGIDELQIRYGARRVPAHRRGQLWRTALPDGPARSREEEEHVEALAGLRFRRER